MNYNIAATIYLNNHFLVYAQHETRRFLLIFIIDLNLNFLSSRIRFKSYIDNTIKKTRQKFI